MGREECWTVTATATTIQLVYQDDDAAMMCASLARALNQQGRLAPQDEGRLSRLFRSRERRRWVVGSDMSGGRDGTILIAPTSDEVMASVGRWPDAHVIVAQSLCPSSDLEIDVSVLPRLIPDCFFPPGIDADVFGLTQRYHLESRPRLVYLGGYHDGSVLTRLLNVASRLLSHDGELVLVDSVMHRAALAPVVRHLGLAEKAVFLPEIKQEELAGLLLGADLILGVDPWATPRAAMSACLASGTPIVAQHSVTNEAILGTAALWVYETEIDVWIKACNKALLEESVREELSRRALRIAEPWRVSHGLSLWITAL